MMMQRRKGEEVTSQQEQRPPSELGRSSSKTAKNAAKQRSRNAGRMVAAAVGGGVLVALAAAMVLLYSGGSSTSLSALWRSLSEPLSTRKKAGAEADEIITTFSGGVEYHIVFSTGCSLYQDWQSYVFFYHTMTSRQPGTVTRLVSGCKDADEEVKMQAIFDAEIAPMAPDGRFRLHITPDYSKLKGGGTFVYFNKPFGMRHWLEHALGFPHDPVNKDAIVILMDPDQLILRPFTNNDFTNTEWRFLKKGAMNAARISIEHGKPMGQLYGFGLQFLDKVNITELAPAGSPLHTMTRDEAKAGYIVGPPYIATAQGTVGGKGRSDIPCLCCFARLCRPSHMPHWPLFWKSHCGFVFSPSIAVHRHVRDRHAVVRVRAPRPRAVPVPAGRDVRVLPGGRPRRPPAPDGGLVHDIGRGGREDRGLVVH
jgi:hypothetical protein